MKVLIRPSEVFKRINVHVGQFGRMPDHHAYFIYYDASPGYELLYFDFGREGGAVVQKKRNRWYIMGEPLTRAESRVSRSRDVITYIFKTDTYAKLIIEEWSEELSKELMHSLPLGFRAARPHFLYYWPVCNLTAFDNNLRGGTYKGFRYIMNRFSGRHSVEIIDARTVPTDTLREVLFRWKESCKKMRGERVDTHAMQRFIENKFPGCDIRRAIFIDGELRGLSAGWGIPNSRNYYIYLGIHDYSDEYLGEFVDLDHFLEAKKRGYEFLDFGGSDALLLNFKKKFHPVRIYKTYNFSILRDDSRA